MRDLTYPPVILTAKLAFRGLGLHFDLVGTDRVPRTGGVLLACNHIGYADFVFGGLAANPSGRKVRFMAKREIFDHGVAGPVMRSMHHISVDRDMGAGSFRTGVEYLRAGEAVGIFPEATISRAFELKEFKTGAVRLAAAAGVPVLPVIMWGTHRIVTKDHPRDLSRGKTIVLSVGEPQHPTGDDPTAETEQLKSAMAVLLDDAIERYPDAEQPPGSWWLPARFGGSAPTLERAAELDAEEKRARAAKRAAKRKAAQEKAQKTAK